MNRHLLDVNVLLALVWPPHESYAAAHAWFDKSGQQAWATNVLTQLGVLRLLTNPSVTQTAVTAFAAWDLLRENTSRPGHEFWPLDRQMIAGFELMASRVRGHQQWTDALLLWQAKEKGGVFVTFDSGVKGLATGEFRSHLLLLKSR
jgi:toxin-antitoxin system PIN domain toxin